MKETVVFEDLGDPQHVLPSCYIAGLRAGVGSGAPVTWFTTKPLAISQPYANRIFVPDCSSPVPTLQDLPEFNTHPAFELFLAVHFINRV